MKNLVKGILAILVCGLFFMSFAPKNWGGDLEEKLEKIKTELQLTDEQTAEVKILFENFHSEMKALKEQEGNREDKFEAFHALKETHKAELAKVLNEEQMVKFEEMMRHRKRHRGERHDHNWEEMKSVKSEVMDYVKTNIVPTITEQRAKLDKDMSQQDIQRVEELRAELKEIKGQIDDRFDKFKERQRRNKEKFDKKCEKSRENGVENGIEKECEKGEGRSKYYGEGHGHGYHKHHSKMKGAAKTQLEEAQKIADKYETEINNLMAPIRANEEEWKKAIYDIVAEKVGEEKAQHIVGHITRKRFRKIFSSTGFLLFDADFINDLDRSGKSNVKGNAKQRMMKVFPNPTSGKNTFTYEVLETGSVKIDLFNQQGRFIETIVEEVKNVGTYTIEVDLTCYEKDVYFYQIMDASGKSSQRFVVK